MTTLAASYTRPRKNYRKIRPAHELPYLIEVQRDSYKQFLQDLPNALVQRKNFGLQSVFNSVFPVKDKEDDNKVEIATAVVAFKSYNFEQPRYTVAECRQRGMNYAAPLHVTISLSVWDVDKETNARSMRHVKEQTVFFGDIPLMTESGTFVINGTERVVVSQLHRSAGVFFDHDKGKNSTSGKVLYSARVIPYRGSWIDFEFDAKDILHVRIDRRRKMPATILLRALGYSAEELISRFYKKETVKIIRSKDGIRFDKKLDFEILKGQKSLGDIVDPKTGKILVKKNARITQTSIKNIEAAGLQYQTIESSALVGKVLGEAVYKKNGEMLLPLNHAIEASNLPELAENAEQFSILFIDGMNSDDSFRATLNSDKIDSKDRSEQDNAIIELYRRLRPGEPATIDPAKSFFNNLFFDEDRYDLSTVGRMKLNRSLGLELPLEQRTLTNQDILKVIEKLLKIKVTGGQADDIDNLGNRRVRAVGELLENQYRVGLLRIERAIKERLQSTDVDSILPSDLINNKPASGVVREFFGSSQLSQFMDQTNPLSEVTHKRRLSALGPGGLNRDRAGFEVRDVHPTHYGRICPVETPEGPNIGLISSLASYARVNEYGFIETPYESISGGDVGKVRYYDAIAEHEEHVISQASSRGAKPDEFIIARSVGETKTVRATEADLRDVATTQLVSVAASLIPFLQNDDANRALMGSNMMRQAVPLIKTAAPLVGTGMERIVAKDSGATIVALRDGVVASVDAERIVVKIENEGSDNLTDVGTDVDIYPLHKYRRSNLDTCINQKPIVNVGESVKHGDIIADGFATEMGELALGQNVTVAFMPWNGYNFEDSILISERVVKEDLYTSVHIQAFECLARDTKLGSEEITADIPNVGEEALRNLDDAGIIRVGAEVKPGDILVGKITPKGETQATPEEKLLRAIFGEKAGDVRDTSLRVDPGVAGTVIGAKVFTREGADRDSRSKQIEEAEEARLRKDELDKINIIKDSALGKILRIAEGEKLAEEILDRNGVKILDKGTLVSKSMLEDAGYQSWFNLSVTSAEKQKLLSKVLENLKFKVGQIRQMTDDALKKLTKGDELPPTVIKMVKVYVAIKRKLQVGDKMAGRHGNKGVVSRILPEEDMPFLEDGTPVDVVLNPLGVPSRMNVGQILETHLGWAAKNLGKQLNQVMETAFDRKNLERMCLEIWDTENVKDEVSAFVKKCSDDELKLFIAKFRDGVHVANPVFDGVTEDEIQDALKLSGVHVDGQVDLYDGLTGDKFKNRVTVGVMYMLKLHHLVDEKIHARSIGPYSLVTQQPLGGKAQFGGQRLGEMEVWAMEAYGAAYTLQEMLTVKSDDTVGRTRMYESIVKGSNEMKPGLPESFNVLIKELQALGLDVNLIKQNGAEVGLENMQ